MQIVFNYVDEAVKALKLDRRRKYFEWSGKLVYNGYVTTPCSGCSEYNEGCYDSSSGCHECGYTGKRRTCYPCCVIINNSPVKINLLNN